MFIKVNIKYSKPKRTIFFKRTFQKTIVFRLKERCFNKLWKKYSFFLPKKKIFWTYEITERTILLSKRFYLMIVQWENERNNFFNIKRDELWWTKEMKNKRTRLFLFTLKYKNLNLIRWHVVDLSVNVSITSKLIRSKLAKHIYIYIY